MEKETHPYISKYFDINRSYKYLIIGTFPPNKAVREDAKAYVDFFYGNKGSLWKIIEKIYPSYPFSKVSKHQRIEMIKSWLSEYEIGITDTILACTRKDINSADDADLIIDWDGYNHHLKPYIIQHIAAIDRIIFTSSIDCNSAFHTFKTIMGPDIQKIPFEKLVTDLPSPSGSSNAAMFNVNTDETLGIHPDLFSFVQQQQPQQLAALQKRWSIKKQKIQMQPSDPDRKAVSVPAAPKGLLADYKVWKYQQVLPKAK